MRLLPRCYSKRSFVAEPSPKLPDSRTGYLSSLELEVFPQNRNPAKAAKNNETSTQILIFFSSHSHTGLLIPKQDIPQGGPWSTTRYQRLIRFCARVRGEKSSPGWLHKTCLGFDYPHLEKLCGDWIFHRGEDPGKLFVFKWNDEQEQEHLSVINPRHTYDSYNVPFKRVL